MRLPNCCNGNGAFISKQIYFAMCTSSLYLFACTPAFSLLKLLCFSLLFTMTTGMSHSLSLYSLLVYLSPSLIALDTFPLLSVYTE
jgi:hypothetical protein